MSDLGVPRPELRLVIFMPVPLEAEPAHAVEDRRNRVIGRARPVGVLDPQQELAATVTGIEPVEQRSARATDMQISGRRGREAGDDRPRRITCAQARFPLLLFLQCNGRAPLT